MRMNYYAIPGLKPDPLFDIRNQFQRADKIIDDVSEHFKIPVACLIKKGRKPHNVFARFVAMTLIRKHTNLSLKDIGAKFNRDHTTVINSVKTMKGFLNTHHLTKERESVENFLTKYGY